MTPEAALAHCLDTLSATWEALETLDLPAPPGGGPPPREALMEALSVAGLMAAGARHLLRGLPFEFAVEVDPEAKPFSWRARKRAGRFTKLVIGRGHVPALAAELHRLGRPGDALGLLVQADTAP